MSKKSSKKGNNCSVIKSYDVLDCTCNSCGAKFQTIKNYHKSKKTCPNCGWDEITVKL